MICIDGRKASCGNIANFENLGMEMVAKCDGLPLAIVTLAGLLQEKEALDDWENVNKACRHCILEDGGVEKIVALSYIDLPSHLKPCLLYLAVFPEDAQISATLVTQLWIAEGLVTEDQRRGEEALEDVAKRFLDELVRRCMLQVASKNTAGIVKKYRLHDVLQEFCMKKAKDQSFLEVFSHVNQSALDAKVSSLQARRAAFHSKISIPTQSWQLRSLISIDNLGDKYISIEDKMSMNMNPVYDHLKLLRVLKLYGIRTSSGELSKEIGILIHLRYLAIKCTNIEVFPQAIGNLRNLLTLDLRHNPRGALCAFTLHNMTRIRHLYFPHRVNFSSSNLGLEKLKDLQTLKNISGKSLKMEEIENVSRGIKKLAIWHISSKKQLEAVYRCPSIISDSTRELLVHVSCSQHDLSFDVAELDKCLHLQKLTFCGRIKEDKTMTKPFRFPPINIVHLSFWQCSIERPDWMTALKSLSCLKFLWLQNGSYVGEQLIVRAGVFPQLQKLWLFELLNLKEWIVEEAAFPCLTHLRFVRCLNLQGLPEGLKTTTTLQELDVKFMKVAFCKCLGWEEQDGFDKTIIRNSVKTTNQDGGDESSRKGSREASHIMDHQYIPTIIIRNPLTPEKEFY